jgi:hypothetical protein
MIMQDLSSFSFTDAYSFLIKAIVAVAALGLVLFCFLLLRQVQMMNTVVRTRLAPVFVMIGFVLLLGAVGLFVLVLLNLLV